MSSKRTDGPGSIGLLDPSIPEARQITDPDNVGDLIISQAVNKVLSGIFAKQRIVRFPTKRPLDRLEAASLRRCSSRFVGGTNLLSSDLRSYNQWKIRTSGPGRWFCPARELILLGVGWWQYQDDPTPFTTAFYRSTLSRRRLHAARDAYTVEKLKTMGFEQAVNTSCPTLWDLDGLPTGRREQTKEVVFTLTDYNPDTMADNALVEWLAATPYPLAFFPQGRGDIRYLQSLPAYQAAPSRIVILERSLASFDAAAEIPGATYIGTRLHGGIRFLQKGRSALILAVDNRAIEIHRDTALPVVNRSDLTATQAWFEDRLDFGRLKLPTEAIFAWKAQFSETECA